MNTYFKEAFSLKITPNGEITRDILNGQKFILYVYPKDNTSACTLEANEFAEIYDEVKQLGYEIYGISKDTLSAHIKFKEKYKLPFDLISDPEKMLLEALEVVKDKKMYGKMVKGTVRSTFIFEEGLKLRAEFRDIKAPGHARVILDFIQV